MVSYGWYRRGGKRALDVLLTLPALVVLSPMLAVLAVLVRVRLGAPVLFRQTRPGLHGHPFTILKFRTMTDARNDVGQLLPDTERLTMLGRFLRSTSLDELPELITVLKGDMSLVGPRPLLLRYYPYFTDEERIRFEVRPGITGLAQISGRNDLSWDMRIASDVYYCHEYSLMLDVRIIAETLWHVVRRQGVRVDPGSTMLDFDEERRLGEHNI